MAYVDTSVLGAYYCPELLSRAANAALSKLPEAVISPLVEVEFCSLLSLKVRTGGIPRAAATTVLAQFRIHIADDVYRLVTPGAREFELARLWLSSFDTPLRTIDALHLATAWSNRLEILTCDKILAKGARQLGVAVRLIA